LLPHLITIKWLAEQSPESGLLPKELHQICESKFHPRRSIHAKLQAKNVCILRMRSASPNDQERLAFSGKPPAESTSEPGAVAVANGTQEPFDMIEFTAPDRTIKLQGDRPALGIAQDVDTHSVKVDGVAF
jgi:hypothetical protein